MVKGKITLIVEHEHDTVLSVKEQQVIDNLEAYVKQRFDGMLELINDYVATEGKNMGAVHGHYDKEFCAEQFLCPPSITLDRATSGDVVPESFLEVHKIPLEVSENEAGNMVIPTDASQAPVDPAAPVEADGSGRPWDKRIDSNPPKLTTKGLWRRRKNLTDEFYNRIKAEMTMIPAGIPVETNHGALTPPPAPEPPTTPVSAVAVPPAPTPPTPPLPRVPNAPLPVYSFLDLMNKSQGIHGEMNALSELNKLAVKYGYKAIALATGDQPAMTAIYNELI